MRGPGEAIEATGVVKEVLHAPRGEVNGVLLADGTIVRLPPPEATRMADALAVGKTVFVRGSGYAGALGKVVAAREIGPDATHLTAVRGPHPGGWRGEHGPKGMHGPEGMHGPRGMGPGGMPTPPRG